MFYVTVITATALITALFNTVFSPPVTLNSAMYYLFCSVFSVIAVIAVDGIFAFIIRRLPEKWFLLESKIFAVSKKESRFYRKLKINSWKNKVPELGCFTGFHKDKLQSSTDPEYLFRFLLESNYGVAIHIANAVLGFLITFIPFSASAGISIPVIMVNAFLSLLPVAILRSNTPALKLLYDKIIKKNIY